MKRLLSGINFIFFVALWVYSAIMTSPPVNRSDFNDKSSYISEVERMLRVNAEFFIQMSLIICVPSFIYAVYLIRKSQSSFLLSLFCLFYMCISICVLISTPVNDIFFKSYLYVSLSMICLTVTHVTATIICVMIMIKKVKAKRERKKQLDKQWDDFINDGLK